MAGSMRTALVVLPASLALCAAAAEATNPEQLRLQASLKAQMAKVFAKKAPGVKLTALTCKLPSSGVTAHCVAHFTAGPVKGYYPVTATIHASGTLTWTAASPTCFVAKTGKRTPC